MSGGVHLGERLSVLLDGELSAAERAAAEAHLRECASCAQKLEELAAVDTLVRQEPLSAPEGYFEALPGRVRTRIRERRRAPRPAMWTAAAVAAAVVLVSVVAPLTLRHAPAVGPPARSEEQARPVAPQAEPAAHSDTPVAGGEAAAAPALAAPAKAAAPLPQALAKRAAPVPMDERRRQPPADADARETRDRMASVAAQAGAPAAPPVAAPAAPGAAAETANNAARARPELKAEDAEREKDFAQAPAAAVLSATPAPAGSLAAAEKPKESAAPAARKLGVAGGSAFAHPDRALMDDQRFRSLAARRPASAAEARALREAWEMFARDRPDDPRGDEARVRAIESGITAWRLGGDKADLATARAAARAYLSVATAPQRARVQSALDGLPLEP
jgi:predicted anti-sigma-YlaC factor YlaD